MPRDAITAPPLGHRIIAAAVTVLGGAITAHWVDMHWPLDHVVFMVFALLAPAVAIYRFLPSVSPALALLVAAAGAAVVNGLTAQVMLTANAWSRPGGILAVGVIAAVLWLVPSSAAQSTRDAGSASEPGRFKGGIK